MAGPKSEFRGPVCYTCRHPKIDAINADLLSGRAGIKETAARYGLDYRNVLRHKNTCLSEAVEVAKAARPRDMGRSVLDRAEHLYNEALAVLERGKAGRERVKAEWLAMVPEAHREGLGDVLDALAAHDGQVLKAIREARPVIELMGRIVGDLKEDVVVNLHASPEFGALRRILLTALLPHREALLDVAEGLNVYLQRSGAKPRPITEIQMPPPSSADDEGTDE